MSLEEAIELTTKFPFFKRLARGAISFACRNNSTEQLVERIQHLSTFSHVDWLRNLLQARGILAQFASPRAFKIYGDDLKLSESRARSVMEEFLAFCDWNITNSWPSGHDCTTDELQQLTIDCFDMMLKRSFQRALYREAWTQRLSELCRSLSKLPNSLQIESSRLEIVDKDKFVSGGHGSIYKAVLRNDGSENEEVAVKFMIRYCGQKWTGLHDEALNLLNLDFPGLHPFKGVTVDPQRGLGLVSPYCRGGNAVEFLNRQEASTTERIVWVCSVFPVIISAIHHLHYVHLTHGDIKGANILIGDDGNPYLTDFGLARVATDQDIAGKPVSETGSYHFTLRFCSPERRRSPHNFCSTSDDVWALGMTMSELLTGKKPLYRLIDPEVEIGLYGGDAEIIELRRSDIPTEVCDNLWELIEGCTRVDVTRRWTSFRCYSVMRRIQGEYALGGERMLLKQ